MEVLARARAYTAAVPGAISRQRGHDQTFGLANALTWGFGLDDDTTLELMLEWNPTCQPPWKERDLRRKISESRKASHQKPFGYLLTGGDRPHIRACGRALQVAPPAETAVWKLNRRPAVESKPTATEHIKSPNGASSQPTPSVETMVKPPPLLVVLGCKIGRPPEIQMSDADWHALEASGLAEEPLVQFAAWMFGPSCTVLEETGRADT
ncbi:MAG: hypothetical protein INR62_02075 [Rhodospirillales bacterium]|nr:hypothetical protein [Acetobacter sp.]